MNYRSINDLNEVILKRIHIIPRDIDLVVGIPRSGMLPANLIALYLNLPYTDIHSFIKGYSYGSGDRKQFFESTDFKKILIVDDSIASGSALKECKENLKHLNSKYEFVYCAIYAVPEKKFFVDFVFETVATPRYFQWNILNHKTLEKACFDIDGVLCVDPSPKQNDDGEEYRSFLMSAKPLFIPKSKIGTLVTSRLEKYRNETEFWLKDNNVKYDKLVMLDLPDMKARQRSNCHASHKAGEYKLSKYNLFVESDFSQALEINRISGKPVFCTENFQMIFDNQSLTYNIKSGKHLPFLRAFALKIRNRIRTMNWRITSQRSVSTPTN